MISGQRAKRLPTLVRLQRKLGRFNLRLVLLSSTLTIVFAGPLPGAAPQRPAAPGDAVKLRPDLIVQLVTVERTGFSLADINQVEITVRVRNAATFGNCAGPFTVRLEKRTVIPHRKTLFTLLGETEVPRVCADPAAARVMTAAAVFEDSVPYGVTRRYRARIDSGDVIEEANEGNNTGLSEDYTGVCDGVVFGIDWVEITRGSSGGIFIFAHAHNECAGSCSGEVHWYIDEDEAVPGAPGITQGPMADGVDPLAEFTTSGWLGVAYTEGADNTYTVRIEAEPPCDLADSCRVTLLAEESEKRVESCAGGI